jgi:putative endonuclease
MTIVARNFRTRNGSAEVDLIGREGPTLVFIEVKTRASEDFGAPEEAVDREKRRRLVRAASEYLRRCRADESSARFDIVSVTGYDKPSIRHFADAFRPFQDSSTL